jgi:ABC-2 type transport system permease protein
MEAAAQELRPVAGPSATGGGRRRFLDLLWLMAVTEFKKAYFGTVLGYLWSLIRPLMLFAVLLAVFTQVFKLGSDVPNYPVMLLLNIVVFSFFQEATINAVTSVAAQEGVVRKTQFPRLVIPLAVVLTGLFNLGMNMIAVLIFILAYGVAPTWTWLLLPLVIAVLTIFTTAASMIVSSLYVRYRDVAIIWTVLVTVFFYGTPILYPLEIVPDTLHDILIVNPLTPIFEQMRAWVIDPDAPGAVDAAGGVLGLLPAASIYVATCVLGVWVFNREAPRIAEEL